MLKYAIAIISYSKVAIFASLVSLRMLTLASNSDLVIWGWTLLLSFLCSYIDNRVPAETHTRGSSRCSSTLNSSLIAAAGVRLGWWVLRSCIRFVPTSWLAGHKTRLRARSSTSVHPGALQRGLTSSLVLWSLSWVGSVWCKSLNRKLVWSGPRPDSLASLQEFSQSVPGLDNSTFDELHLTWFSHLHSAASFQGYSVPLFLRHCSHI